MDILCGLGMSALRAADTHPLVLQSSMLMLQLHLSAPPTSEKMQGLNSSRCSAKNQKGGRTG